MSTNKKDTQIPLHEIIIASSKDEIQQCFDVVCHVYCALDGKQDLDVSRELMCFITNKSFP
jgi:hypothetical protein